MKIITFIFVFFCYHKKSQKIKQLSLASSIVVYFSGSAPRLQFRQHSNLSQCVSVFSRCFASHSYIDVQPSYYTAIMTFSVEQLFRSLVHTTEYKCCVRDADEFDVCVCQWNREQAMCTGKRCVQWLRHDFSDWRERENRMDGFSETKAPVYNILMENGRVRKGNQMSATFCVAFDSKCRQVISRLWK